MPDAFPRRLSSAAACAIAAARALDAVDIWLDQLTLAERAEVGRRLRQRSEYRADILWTDARLRSEK